MSQHDNYFTFPIAFLQLGKSINDVSAAEASTRAASIVDWCLWQMTLLNARQQTSDPNGYTKIREIAYRHEAFELEVSWGEDQEEQVLFLASQVVLGVRCSSPVDWKAKQDAAYKLEAIVDRAAGKKLARVRAGILFQVINGQMQWRDFAVLASIYAGCFDKTRKAVSLRMSQFGVMSLGYGSQKHCHQHNAESLVLSDKAIGRTVEKLRTKGWFVKASPDNGRTTYYSNSLSEDQMIHYVAKIKADRSQKKRRTLREIQKHVNVTAQIGPEATARLKAAFRDRQRGG